MNKPRLYTIVGMIFSAALMRLMPHPWNVTPVAAMALYAGTYVPGRAAAFAIPLAALALSDLVLGWHPTLFFVYGSFALTVLIGMALRSRTSLFSVTVASLSSSALFFFITNFGVWVTTSMYPKSLAGLAQCYTAALPFFRNSLFGDLFFTAALFGGFQAAVRAFPALRSPVPASK